MSCYAVLIYNRWKDLVGSAVIDEEDVEKVAQYRWSLVNGYARTGSRRTPSTSMHRMILGLPAGRVPEVDHLNGDTLDNRRCNLRIATRQENNQNTNHFTGVDFNKCKWRARVRVDKVLHHLGYFDNKEEAMQVAAAFRAQHVKAVEAPEVISRVGLPVAPVRPRMKG